uniref:Polyprotein protein n=1 Tax=Solanum tuberosum TaxID=4113 RepID=M1DX98_SOLTU
MVQIQSMDISTLWGEVPFPDAPEMPSVVLSTAMLGVVLNVETIDDMEIERANEDLAEETDEEELRDQEHDIAETLAKLHETGEVILQAVLERSLQETSEVGSSGVTLDFTILHVAKTGTNALVVPPVLPHVILLSGNDAPLEAFPP